MLIAVYSIQAGLPLKSSYDPHGILYEQQVFLMLRDIYSYGIMHLIAKDLY